MDRIGAVLGHEDGSQLVEVRQTLSSPADRLQHHAELLVTRAAGSAISPDPRATAINRRMPHPNDAAADTDMRAARTRRASS
jgi:hypothetical protein